jgi:hypothetical protein
MPQACEWNKPFRFRDTINGCVLLTSSRWARANPPFFDLTTPPEAASCRPCSVIGKAVWIPNARRHVFIHLDNLLPQRARRPFGLRPASLLYYLPLSQESETRAGGGMQILTIAGRDRAITYLQRSLCSGEIAALGQ